MKKAILSIVAALAIAPVAMAGLSDTLPQDASGFDRFTLSDPFLPVGAFSSNFSGWRDNIDANGDTWLATNAAHFVKIDADNNGPSVNDAAFAGVYRGATGDTAEVYYDFVAGSAIDSVPFAAACTVVRSAGRAARLQVSAIVNGTTVASVNTPYWESNDVATVAGAIAVGTGPGYFGDYGVAGIVNMSLDSLGIVAGDTVRIKARMIPNDGGGLQAKNLGLGIMLPEPATMSLLGVGALALIRRKK